MAWEFNNKKVAAEYSKLLDIYIQDPEHRKELLWNMLNNFYKYLAYLCGTILFGDISKTSVVNTFSLEMMDLFQKQAFDLANFPTVADFGRYAYTRFQSIISHKLNTAFPVLPPETSEYGPNNSAPLLGTFVPSNSQWSRLRRKLHENAQWRQKFEAVLENCRTQGTLEEQDLQLLRDYYLEYGLMKDIAQRYNTGFHVIQLRLRELRGRICEIREIQNFLREIFPTIFSPIPISTTPEQDLIIKDAAEFVFQLTQRMYQEGKLSSREYTLLRQCTVEDLSIKEISKRTGVPTQTLYSRFSRLLKKILQEFPEGIELLGN